MMEVAPRMPRRAPDAALLPAARRGRSSRSCLLRTVTSDSAASPAAGWAGARGELCIENYLHL